MYDTILNEIYGAAIERDAGQLDGNDACRYAGHDNVILMDHFLFGDLTWSALPHQWFTIGGTAAIVVWLGICCGGAHVLQALEVAVERMAHVHRPEKDRHHVYRDGVGHALPRGIGCGDDLAAAVAPPVRRDSGATQGYLDASHFQQIFTAHGDIMVFFVTMGFFFGLMNLIVPLQIGARDLAFPFLNSLGFWLYVAGAMFINMFFVVGGEFAASRLALAPAALGAAISARAPAWIIGYGACRFPDSDRCLAASTSSSLF